MEANNAQKMREALLILRDYVQGVDVRARLTYEQYATLTSKIDAALSAPARNCDVGSAEEQVARYYAYCYRMMKQNNHCCGPCPCYKFVNGEAQPCTLIWAQMPYEAKEGGAK